MAEFATNGKANAALTTGIIGTAGVGAALLNGGLNGLFGDPEETEKAMSVILPLKTRERLEVLKRETGMTFSEIIARAVDGYNG